MGGALWYKGYGADMPISSRKATDGSGNEEMLANVSTAVALPRSGPLASAGRVPALTIVSHPFARRAGERLPLVALSSGGEVQLSRNSPEFRHPGSQLGRPLSDPFMSRKPIRLRVSREGQVELVVEDGGTAIGVGQPLRAGDGQEKVVPIELAGRVLLLLHWIQPEEENAGDVMGMLGHSASICRVRRDIDRVSDLSSPVLIRGETGTGKELVARALHERGPRRNGPFISVNMGAIPKDLAAAELFGAHKGAFTGAARERDGFFRAAHGGTLFLDEIGEAPPNVQVMLLRVLETGQVYAIGGSAPINVDVRLVSATDADLENRIRDGRFRAPLLHRLAGFEIRLPPLRERREDIGMLFFHFAHEEMAAIGNTNLLTPSNAYAEPWLPASIASLLVRHTWPGNIRQLRNMARQIVIESRGLDCAQIDPRLARELGAEASPALSRAAPVLAAHTPGRAPRRRPADIAPGDLVAALRAAAWDFQAAADLLGIPRSSMYDLVKRTSGVRTAGDLHPDEIERCYLECDGDLDAMVERLEVSGRALKRRIKELGLTRDADGEPVGRGGRDR